MSCEALRTIAEAVACYLYWSTVAAVVVFGLALWLSNREG